MTKLAYGQSRLVSLVESILNIAIGFGVSMIANLLVLPLWGYNVTLKAAFEIGLVFTLISIVRSYGVRRLFNALHLRRLP